MDQVQGVDEPIKNQFNFFLIQIATTFITGVFLALWAAIQYGTNYAIGLFEPSGVDRIIFWTFQGIFAVTTLIPVIVYFYVDTRVIWMRAQRAIDLERERLAVIGRGR